MQTDLSIIAKTIYGEARGEGKIGMQAVATVIWNRAKPDKDKLALVCLKPKAFSCWNGVDDIIIKEPTAYKTAEGIAKKMLNSTFTYYPFDIHGITPTNYLTVTLYNSPKCPTWAKGVSGVIIGKHIFIELKNW